MSLERVYYCDGPECERHVQTAAERPQGGFIFVEEGGSAALHFCTWDCVLKYAATKPPVELVAFD